MSKRAMLPLYFQCDPAKKKSEIHANIEILLTYDVSFCHQIEAVAECHKLGGKARAGVKERAPSGEKLQRRVSVESRPRRRTAMVHLMSQLSCKPRPQRDSIIHGYYGRTAQRASQIVLLNLRSGSEV